MQSSLHKHQSLSTFVAYYIMRFVLLIICATIILISLYGIYEEFISKKSEVSTHAHLIAATAFLEDNHEINLSEHQLEEIRKHDPLILAVKSYDINENVHIEESSFSKLLYQAIFDDVYVVNTALDFHLLSDKVQNSSKSSINKQEYNQYISIFIDLKELRRQWLKEHTSLFVMIALLYLIIGLFIYIHSFKIRTQLTTLQKLANELVDSAGNVSLPTGSANVSFEEYQDIKDGIVNLVNIYNDSQQELERIQKQAQEMQERDGQMTGQRNQLQSIMVDELNHSLGSISRGLQVLGSQYLSEEQQDAVSVIRKGTQQLEFILGQIIQLQRIESGQVLVSQVEFNPLQLLSDILTDFRDTTTNEDIELISDVAHMEHMLEGDIDKIQRIIIALISNALKYTQQGYIKVSSSLQHFDETTRWTVRVEDTGIGIGKKELNNIFLPLFQVDNDINQKNYGIGIGLTLAKQLADLIGATLKVTSEPDKGSVFELVIPLLKKIQKAQKKYLKNRHIMYFDSTQKYLLASELERYGADELSMFHNIDEAMLAISQQTLEVLLVANNQNSEPVNKMLTERFRAFESNHRALVIWLNFDINSLPKEASTQAMGVDVCLTEDITAKEIAETVNDWLN